MVLPLRNRPRPIANTDKIFHLPRIRTEQIEDWEDNKILKVQVVNMSFSKKIEPSLNCRVVVCKWTELFEQVSLFGFSFIAQTKIYY